MSKHFRNIFEQNPISKTNRSKSCSTHSTKILVPVIKPKDSDLTPSPFHLFEDVFTMDHSVSEDSNEETVESKTSYNNNVSPIRFYSTNIINTNTITITNESDIKDSKTKVSILGKLILKRKYSQK